MDLPVKITPCPIIDVTFGINFESNIPSGAIFGILFNEFKNKYPNYEELPILQIPEALRKSDNNLKYQAHYRLSNEIYNLFIGSNTLSISNPKNYVGWDDFSKEVFNVINVIKKLDLIKSISRFGLRYVDFFPNINILDKIKNKVIIENSIETHITSIIKDENFAQILKMMSNIKLTQNGSEYFGSVIDIDTYKNECESDILINFTEVINLAHLTEKKLFFSLLSEQFLKSLSPEYKDNN